MREFLDRRILFVGGKGGVGKTTTASALALMAAESGRHVLIVSMDPAHSLGDIFGVDIGNREVPLAEGLWGLEIDPDAEAEHHIRTVKASMKSLVAPKMYREVDRQLDLAQDAPGTVEAAVLERMSELMSDAMGRFDLVVFDTAPTGHTIRLLSLPEVMAAWSDGMLKHQDRSQKLGQVLKVFSRHQTKEDEFGMIGGGEKDDEDPRTTRINAILLARRRKFHRARELLTDEDTTAFVLVINPERLPILESKKALKVLNKFNVPVAAMVVNRLLPDDADSEFLRERRLQEQEYRDEIDREFAGLRRVDVPLLAHDVYGIETLREIGRILVPEAGDAGDPGGQGPTSP